MSFQLCGKRVDFYFPPHTTSIAPAIHPYPIVFIHSAPLAAVIRVKMFDGNGGPNMSSVTFFDFPLPIPASPGGTFDSPKRE